MPAEYVKDPGTGIVHLTLNFGDGESTFCGRMTDGDTATEGFLSEFSGGPSTCVECWEAVVRMRDGLRGAKFYLRGSRNSAAQKWYDT